jgi:hypothetical protein
MPCQQVGCGHDQGRHILTDDPNGKPVEWCMDCEMSCNFVPAAFYVGQPVRWKGLVRLPMEAGDEGKVLGFEPRMQGHIVRVDFPGVGVENCWPAELEAV